MIKRADKTKAKLALAKPGASGKTRMKDTPGSVRAGIAKPSSSEADPHDPLLVLVRHTYAQRVCHPHGG
jgi:hypothetical protein